MKVKERTILTNSTAVRGTKEGCETWSPTNVQKNMLAETGRAIAYHVTTRTKTSPQIHGLRQQSSMRELYCLLCGQWAEVAITGWYTRERKRPARGSSRSGCDYVREMEDRAEKTGGLGEGLAQPSSSSGCVSMKSRAPSWRNPQNYPSAYLHVCE